MDLSCGGIYADKAENERGEIEGNVTIGDSFIREQDAMQGCIFHTFTSLQLPTSTSTSTSNYNNILGVTYTRFVTSKAVFCATKEAAITVPLTATGTISDESTHGIGP